MSGLKDATPEDDVDRPMRLGCHNAPRHCDVPGRLGGRRNDAVDEVVSPSEQRDDDD